MKINKTADECIVESSMVLLKSFVDPNFSLVQKQKFTKWITWLFDYQDAINNSNQKEIDFLQKKLSLKYVPLYYKNALQEFQNANIFYNGITSLKELRSKFLNYSTKQINKTVSTFSKTFIKSMITYVNLETKFIDTFHTLTYTIQYHISYIFKKELEKTVKTLIKLLKTKIFYKKENQEMPLINAILKENETFFSEIQEIQLTNFIYKLEEIFQESFIESETELDNKITNLIFSKPKEINVSMNYLLKKNNINFYNEIWTDTNASEKKSKQLMHLFAYETYFIQGHDNHQIYEELVLKNIIIEEKYWIIIHKYKLLNKIK